jgi:hypothetical protein
LHSSLNQGMPKRPLSAYNIFFRKERQVLLGEDLASAHVITDQSRRKHRKTHGKIGFAEMAKLVGQRWKKLDTTTKQGFEEQANSEKARYFERLDVWKKAQEEENLTEEPTETTEPIIRQVRLRDDESQADRGIQAATPVEARQTQRRALPRALPQEETAHFPTIFQRGEDYTNEPRFHGRNAYFPALNASLPANFGGNDPLPTMRGRASLPGNLPSHYGDSSPYARAQGRASLPGGPMDAYRVPPRAHNPQFNGGIWPPQVPSAGFGGDPFYSQAQDFENERVREMEEMYRMHLAEAAHLREQLTQRGETGTAIDHLRQQPGAYPGLIQMQARRASDAPGDMMDTGTAIDHLRQQPGAYPGLIQMQARRATDAPGDMIDMHRGGQAHMTEMLIIERAHAARRADMMELQRVLENERVLRQEEELRV